MLSSLQPTIHPKEKHYFVTTNFLYLVYNKKVPTSKKDVGTFLYNFIMKK